MHITESPVHNPNIECLSDTQIKLSWSPPFISAWPTQSFISYYDIVVKRKNDSVITNVTTFSHDSTLSCTTGTMMTPFESMNISIDQLQNRCWELDITIKAYDRDNVSLPNTANVRKKYTTSK